MLYYILKIKLSNKRISFVGFVELQKYHHLI